MITIDYLKENGWKQHTGFIEWYKIVQTATLPVRFEINPEESSLWVGDNEGPIQMDDINTLEVLEAIFNGSILRSQCKFDESSNLLTYEFLTKKSE